MKDATNRDTLRGGVNNLRSEDFRMGEPSHLATMSQPREVNHLSTSRKRKQSDSLSSGERKGTSPNRRLYAGGVVGLCQGNPGKLPMGDLGEGFWKVPPERVKVPYLKDQPLPGQST